MLDTSLKFPDAVSATKITYIDGRPTTITLRRCKLAVIRNGEMREYVFDKDVITMGAMDDNDIVIDDETVSRNHCRITVDRDSYVITDLDSTNGTFVNRVRVREAFLRPDCTVTLGKTEIRFMPIDENLRIVPSDKDRFGEMIGRNAKMREIYAILEKIAPTDATVIIEGETGTGKEVVARTIHQQSRRREGPFMVFDCGAVPENLIESELFGHEKGSFTGAITTRQGVFEMGNGGVVFMDELGELGKDLQPKLLRVLEQREVRRVGGSQSIRVDVRIVAATNRKLEEEVKAGRFREDLFYRLSVVRVVLPPLRDRKEDIPLLVQHFLDSCNFNKDGKGEKKVTAVSQSVWGHLAAYDWPGNIRELLNVVERAVSFADTHVIEVRDLPDHIARLPALLSSASQEFTRDRRPSDVHAAETVEEEPGGDVNLSQFKEAKERWVSKFEKAYVFELLKKNSMNISHAANEANIDRKYFRKLMKKYGISTDSDNEGPAAETD